MMGAESREKDPRENFLLEMYRQTSSHLNRHILLSWQSVGVIGGALAVLVLGDKLDVKVDGRLDFAISIVVLLCAWSICHVFDANNWFERNLHIIANIERQFLVPSDSKEIHYFFTSHRRTRSKQADERLSLGLIEHLRIQFFMAAGLWVILIGYHFYQRVVPGIGLPVSQFEFVRSVPYLLSIASAVFCLSVWKRRRADYEELLERSPGKELP